MVPKKSLGTSIETCFEMGPSQGLLDDCLKFNLFINFFFDTFCVQISSYKMLF